jgi:flagellar hook protein FlgE
MSIISSLYTGASGLTSHGEALSVVGDNIANADTVGYKRSRANFEDVLAQSVGSGDKDIGLGSRVADVQKILSQGSLLGTGLSTDLAIKGDGFFAVKGTSSGIEGTFYTRAGQFSLDKDGYLVNNDALKVQGYVVDATGTLVKSVTDLKVNNSQIPPVATTAAEIDGNVDSTSTTPTAAWDAQNPDTTSNFSTSMTVYDSLGQSHSLTVFYRDNGAGSWNWYALAKGSEVGAATTWSQIGTGTLTFDTAGALTAGATGSISATFTGAAAQTITLDQTNVTQYASTSNVSYMDQDGYGSGALSGISIGSDGLVTGTFSNGQKQTVGQVLVADFKAAESLSRTGSNLYIETESSGTALLGEAASGGRGTINAGSLEQSNVDLASEFVDMIAFQRGFQANSKIVTTSDEMLQELIALKR